MKNHALMEQIYMKKTIIRTYMKKPRLVRGFDLDTLLWYQLIHICC